ncbi:Lar family restriction alleviation protein [Halioxenophilus aromaticivorans]|uniref:Restriction alleviation protein, Lar family n=1 Tax=Halioxenophilus aromaticivorans TaxID=1306992 RepID=A0AAV3TYQ1_9ALTE
MALQIEPCPFCGSQHLHMVVHKMNYSIACQSCRCRGPQKPNQEQAVMHWNETSRLHSACLKQMPTTTATPGHPMGQPSIKLKPDYR